MLPFFHVAGLGTMFSRLVLVDTVVPEPVAGIYGPTESGSKTTWASAEQLRDHPGSCATTPARTAM